MIQPSAISVEPRRPRPYALLGEQEEWPVNSPRAPGRFGLAAAAEEWRSILGTEGIVSRIIAEVQYGANTVGIEREIPVALRPRTAAQVAAIVRVASRHRVALYPISTGKNWGYGSANPVRDGSVVIDLSALNRIVSFDDDLGLVTVEPGVTQRMLADYLEKRGLDFLVPVTGAGPDASLLGNAVERGYGITPYADHFGAVTSLEAVLPNGEIYRSALSDAGGEAVDRAFKWGVGPYLDGLFSQGSFGIVTTVTIALARRPEHIEGFFFSVKREADLEETVETVREILRTVGGVCGSVNLMNARRILAMTDPYPADRVGVNGIIPDDTVAEMAGRRRVTAWTGAGALYGPKALVKAARRIIRRALKPCVRELFFFTPRETRWAKKVVDAVPFIRKSCLAQTLDRLDATLQLLAGQPSNIALPLAYWTSGSLSNAAAPDPAKDGCGLIWYSPLVPMLPHRVRAYVSMVERVCRAHGMEPLITLTSVSERCFDSTVPLLFDRDDPDESARAKACFDALYEAGRREGFLPYRAGVQSMQKTVNSDSPFWRLVSRFKQAIDPDDLISPGRYAPDGSTP